jgi:hypothetical protein
VDGFVVVRASAWEASSTLALSGWLQFAIDRLFRWEEYFTARSSGNLPMVRCS